jgi:hypothetical protein
MVKAIDLMDESTSTTQPCKLHTRSVKKKTQYKPLKDQGKDHVLTNFYSSYDIWILDSCASNHMVASKHYFSFLVPCTRPLC